MAKKWQQKKKRNSAGNAPPSSVAPNPPYPVSASGRPSDDELTLLAEKMQPKHLRFARLYAQGMPGTQATLEAGFKDRKSGWSLLRRPDVRRYIELMTREASVAARVSLETLIEYLWRQVADPTVTQRQKDQAILQISRILTCGGTTAKPPPAIATRGRDSAGLDDSLVGSIESKILGVSRQPVELPELHQEDEGEEQDP